MPKRPKGMMLVPQAASGPLSVTAAEDLDLVPEKASSLIAEMETAIGGRGALIEILLAADLSPDLAGIIALIGDPQHDHTALATLCQRAKISAAQLFDTFKRATVAKAHILATMKAAAQIPAIAEEVVRAAQTHTEPCQTCNTSGRVQQKPTEKDPHPGDNPCWTCAGKGWITVPGSLEHQRMSFELTGLLKKGGLSVQNTVVVPQQTASPLGGLEQLQQAIGQIIYGPRAPQSDLPVEGSVIPAEEPQP